MQNRHQIIVWGPDNYNTLGLLRSLDTPNLDVTLLIKGNKQGVASASIHCKKCILTKNINEGINFLINNFEEKENFYDRAILIPGGDSYSLAQAQNFEMLSRRFILMCTTDPKTIIRITDKSEMGKLAEEVGLLAPKAFKFSKGDILPAGIKFPVIMKPIEKDIRVEFKYKILNNISALNKFIKILNPNNSYLVQEYVQKENDLLIFGCRLPNGQVKFAGIHIWERWSDDGGGSYGILKPEIPDYIDTEALKRLFEKINYFGLFSAEFGKVGNKAYFYEVNLRNDGFCHLSLQAGANLPLLWVQHSLNLPISASSVMTREAITINEVYDIINVFRRKITWKKYKKDLKEATVFHFYDPKDKKPYKNIKRRRFWEIPLRAFLKSYRPQVIRILHKLGRTRI